eukprot:6198409-Pleurochrysis_carterae.AAC.4
MHAHARGRLHVRGRTRRRPRSFSRVQYPAAISRMATARAHRSKPSPQAQISSCLRSKSPSSGECVRACRRVRVPVEVCVSLWLSLKTCGCVVVRICVRGCMRVALCACVRKCAHVLLLPPSDCFTTPFFSLSNLR